MDFAIAPSLSDGDTEAWDVVCLQVGGGGSERPLRLASFGHRAHAEAFLEDLLAVRFPIAHA